MNNPPDGSNWELLCLYCHDDEHQDSPNSGYRDASTREIHKETPLDFHPFAGLKGILNPEDDDSEQS